MKIGIHTKVSTFQKTAFGGEPLRWTYSVTLGVRCKGLTYDGDYSTSDGAFRAGQAKVKAILALDPRQP